MHSFNTSYKNFENGSIEIFIDKAVNPELETEIFVNANMIHYPLRDYASMWNTMANVVRDYEKIGKRNKKKDDLLRDIRFGKYQKEDGEGVFSRMVVDTLRGGENEQSKAKNPND